MSCFSNISYLKQWEIVTFFFISQADEFLSVHGVYQPENKTIFRDAFANKINFVTQCFAAQNLNFSNQPKGLNFDE